MTKVAAAICCALLIAVTLVVVTSCAGDVASNTATTKATQEPQFKWKMTTFSPANDPRYTANLTHFADMVKEATQGRIEIQLFPSGAIVPNEEIPNALRTGAVQMAESVGSFWATTMPVGNVEYYMPRSFLTSEDTWTVMRDRGLLDLLRKAYAEQNVYMLTFEVGTGSFLMTRNKVSSLAGLSGVKLRATGTAGEYVARLGATATSINTNELYLALKNGTVDGTVLGYEQCDALKLQGVCKYMVFPGFFLAQPMDILINKEAWDSLPNDLKTTMELVGRDFSIWSGIQQAKDRQASTANFKAAGVEFVQLPESDLDVLQQKAAELWDEWAQKDDYCRQAVDILEAYAQEQGR